MSQPNTKLFRSISIIEKDSNGDVLHVWSYPDTSSTLSKIMVCRSGLEGNTHSLQFSFSKFQDNWLYTFIDTNSEQKFAKLENVVATALVIASSDFNPEKYFQLTKALSTIYAETGDPTQVLNCWLELFASNQCSIKGGVLDLKVYDQKNAFLATSIKEIIKMFGEETILIWSALLMKKRIAVFSQNAGSLLKVIRSFPLLVWHRLDWSILRPFMTMSEEEIQDIQSASVYCAGFIDPSVKDKEELFDLLVDVNNLSVFVAPKAKGDFMVTPLHKNVCEILLNMAESSSDQEIIKALTLKTKEILSKLESFKKQGTNYVDMDALKTAKLPPNTDRFLYAVASAEGMTPIGKY